MCEHVLLEPLPDYSDEESESDEQDDEDLNQLRALQKTGTRLVVTLHHYICLGLFIVSVCQALVCRQIAIRI